MQCSLGGDAAGAHTRRRHHHTTCARGDGKGAIARTIVNRQRAATRTHRSESGGASQLALLICTRAHSRSSSHSLNRAQRYSTWDLAAAISQRIAQMVGPNGVAIGIDHIPDLVEWSRSNVNKDGKQPLVEAGTLELHVRDGFQGYAEKGPYDAIHVGAAPERVPEALKQQLRPGGVLLLPVGPNGGAQEFVRVTRDARNPTSFSQQSLFGVRYVPLTTPEKQCPSGRR